MLEIELCKRSSLTQWAIRALLRTKVPHSFSSQDILHDMAVHVSEPEPAALIQIIQPLVIDAE